MPDPKHPGATSPLRIDQITMSGFKQYRDQTTLRFGGADIVLLTGPNGAGKTSVVEALELAVTGDIAIRHGNPSDSNGLRTFVYSSAFDASEAEAASVDVTWCNSGVVVRQSSAMIKASGRGNGQLEDTHSLLNDVGLLDKASRAALRAQTFLYSETLGSVLGMDEKIRKGWLDTFLPERAWGTAFDIGALEAERARQLDRISTQLRAKTAAEEEDRLAFESLGASAVAAGSLGSLQTKWDKRSFHTQLGQLLKVGLLDVTVIKDGHRTATAQEIGDWAAAFVTRAEQVEAKAQARAQDRSAAAGHWKAVQIRLAADALHGLQTVPTGSEISGKLQSMRTPAELKAADAAARHVQTQASQQASLIQNDDGLGTLALLASWRHLVEQDPAAAHRIGLPPSSPEEIDARTTAERQALATAKAAIQSAAAAQTQVANEGAARAKREAELLAVTALDDAFREADPTLAFPLSDDGALDLAAARKLAQQRLDAALGPVGDDEDPSPGDLRAVASRLREWADKRAALERAVGRYSESDLERWSEAESLLKGADDILKELKKLPNAVRAALVNDNFQEPLNDFLQRILGASDHHGRIRDSVRLHFDERALRIRVGDHGKGALNRGLMSLSRSQYTSAMLGTALATNLCQQDPLLGFVCLDDVSDALDLANLTADAQLFRQLAYGPGGRRQLILTNHNEEITDRLVPRLLPPAGRRMRIIELRPGVGDGTVSVKHWEVQGEAAPRGSLSPLRGLLPPI